MRQVIVHEFGGPEVLTIVDTPDPTPGPGELRVQFTSIGMNHAELMGRRGVYKLSTGDPPFTPGLEGGGVVDALGDGVDESWHGQRVTLLPDTPRLANGRGGAYRSHYVCKPDEVIAVPDAVPDEQRGALWLSHFTAWGGLVWLLGKLGITLRGKHIALPAASSAVALAAAQVVRHHGGTAIGLTTSPDKHDALADAYDRLVVTHRDGELQPFHRELKSVTDGAGVDAFFDPVAAGDYLNTEIRALADGGVVIVYGLLGTPGPVDVTPLIRKRAAIHGYVNDHVFGGDGTLAGCRHVLAGFAQGHYSQRVAQTFPLVDVQDAHRVMERGGHIGKLVLLP